jgi:hypothetical protein
MRVDRNLFSDAEFTDNSHLRVIFHQTYHRDRELSRNLNIERMAQGMTTFSNDKKPLGELPKAIKTVLEQTELLCVDMTVAM